MFFLCISLAFFILALQLLWLSGLLTTCPEFAATFMAFLLTTTTSNANLPVSFQKPLLKALLSTYTLIFSPVTLALQSCFDYKPSSLCFQLTPTYSTTMQTLQPLPGLELKSPSIFKSGFSSGLTPHIFH